MIADAVYGQPEERRRIESVAQSASVELHAVWLDAPLAVLEQRITARRGDASDATAAVLHRQLTSIDPPDNWLKLDVGGAVEDATRAFRVALAAQ